MERPALGSIPHFPLAPRRWRNVPWALLSLIACLACACSRQTTTPVAYRGPNPFVSAPDLTTQPGTVFNVKLSSNTVRVEPERFIHSLRSVSRDHTIYIFDKSSEVARSLQPGKIIFVPGLTLQKVTAIAEDGQDLIVGAGEAPLTEAIQNGTLKWDYRVDFQQIAAQREAGGDQPPARAQAPDRVRLARIGADFHGMGGRGSKRGAGLLL